MNNQFMTVGMALVIQALAIVIIVQAYMSYRYVNKDIKTSKVKSDQKFII